VGRFGGGTPEIERINSSKPDPVEERERVRVAQPEEERREMAREARRRIGAKTVLLFKGRDRRGNLISVIPGGVGKGKNVGEKKGT